MNYYGLAPERGNWNVVEFLLLRIIAITRPDLRKALYHDVTYVDDIFFLCPSISAQSAGPLSLSLSLSILLRPTATINQRRGGGRKKNSFLDHQEESSGTAREHHSCAALFSVFHRDTNCAHIHGGTHAR